MGKHLEVLRSRSAQKCLLCVQSKSPQMAKLLALALLATNLSLCLAGWLGSDQPRCDASSTDERCAAAPNVYSTLGVAADADKDVIQKAYRKLARKYHPDKNRDNAAAAEATFAKIAYAYGVLTDPEKREIFDRLGEPGLERMRNGDPSVKKGWLPNDEILRRHHQNDGPEKPLHSIITTTFGFFSKSPTVFGDCTYGSDCGLSILQSTLQPQIVLEA